MRFYYIVLKGSNGLKLYSDPGRGFVFEMRHAAVFGKKQDAEMAAMRMTVVDPRFIGRLTVSDEDEAGQDLGKYTIEDIAEAFHELNLKFGVTLAS